MVTRVPTLGLLVTANLPPINSAIRRATVRPMPEPRIGRCDRIVGLMKRLEDRIDLALFDADARIT